MSNSKVAKSKQPEFQPIAVVGRGCVLPGCHSVDDLWQVVHEGQVQISSAEGDDWRLHQRRVTSERPGEFVPDKMWSSHGGYVRDFASHFNADEFKIDPKLLAGLDPVFLWSMEAARQAMAELANPRELDDAGVILGNLSYPSRKHSQFTEEVWLQQMREGGDITTAAENRFMSGLPAMLVAQGLGLGGNTLALDAACASGLYAIKIACDRLQDGSASLMLAGGVNAADPLFIHMGFCALNALSKTGVSRPFHTQADGLVPAEGAAFVALKRLADARADGDKIYGVIRGVGLSNDGRSGGFLSPSSAGQIAAMRQAYQMSGVDPAAVQFIECHATGTETGDATEIQSLSAVFPNDKAIPLGSLKANLGHLITASGVAGLLKVILAFEQQTIPGTPNATPTLSALESTGFTVPVTSTAWESVGPRIAAVSSFGFGGNNAHLVVQQEHESIPLVSSRPAAVDSTLAIVGLALRTERDKNSDAFARRLNGAGATEENTDANTQVLLAAKSLAFPPNDLKEALGQQLILLELLPEVQALLDNTSPDRSGVYIGMQTDNEVCRYGLRLRLPELDPQGIIADIDKEIAPAINAAGVIGRMPNIPANRISNQLDISGPGFTVSREELSGDAALQLAMAAIQRGELDVAIVGAVDLANEQVHQAAIERIAGVDEGAENPQAADAAILMVVKSMQQARRDGDTILAKIESVNDEPTAQSTGQLAGAHAASGLLNIAAAVQQVRCGSIKPTPIIVRNQSIFGESSCWKLTQEVSGAANFSATDRPRMEVFAAPDRAALAENIKALDYFSMGDGGDGQCRIALVGGDADLPALRERAIKRLSAVNAGPSAWSLDGISYAEMPMNGVVASVFTGAAAAYPGMGKDLFLGFPAVAGTLARQMPRAAVAMQAAFDGADERHSLPSFQLAGCSYLCQFHAKIMNELLQLKSTVAIGLSSGETNAMFAFGAWQNMDSLLEDIDATELYRSALAQDFSSVREAWRLAANETVDWVNYRVLAPVDKLREVIASQDRAYLTIIQSERDAVIGGDRAACDAVLKNLGNPDVIPLGHDLAVHCDVVKPFESTWRSLHSRKTTPPKGMRFYSNYLGGVYELNEESVAAALTGQAIQTIDFPNIINKAWADGVRVFVEHGPRNSLAGAIDEILGSREHLVVSLDHHAVPSVTQLYRASAALWCAGIAIDLSHIDVVKKRLEEPAGPTIAFNLRLPPIESKVKHLHAPASLSQAEVYLPPVTSAGPDHGRLIPAAPALAFTLPHPAPALQLVTALKPQADVASKQKIPQSRVAEPTQQPVAPTPIPPAMAAEHQLLINGHQQMVIAHQAFLAAQMEGQRAFSATMARIQNSLFGAAPAVHASTQAGASVPIATRALAPTAVSNPQPGSSQAVAATSISRPGPSFSRQQLEVLASGKISSVLGELFERQDGYAVQVRMPEPPLLLCDRVTGIEGEAGSMGTGTIWTETDVTPDKWYLHHGRMPPGVFIECGQADLLLISWLGIDLHNRGERAYRLLGCEITFHGDLPKPGDTLQYEIKVDGHASQGDIRLFFFHYDCLIGGQTAISVRNGQAGFFNKDELLDSAGVLWDAATADYTQDATLAVATAVTRKSSFSRKDIAAYLNGELWQCFGPEFASAHTHTRTPGSASGRVNFLGEVTDFDPAGGPAGRGYLRIVEDVHPDDWFFAGHFKNDPCMPGTLMADACLQAMAFYLCARGHSLHRDGWRFQPVRDINYKFACRGQATPQSRQLVYEVFIDEEIVAKVPRIFAHVLCTVDGRKAFLCEKLGLELVPDWPLSSMPECLAPVDDSRPLATIDDFKLDYAALISCAWGKPSDAFGKGFAHYDGPLRSPRLPGPPYHFMTRIVALQGEMASMQAGGRVAALYDIPFEAWYFTENGAATMPYCVLLEIALQPCGWLASYTLGRDYAESDLLFRNLDGKATQHSEIVAGDGTIKTTATLTTISHVGELIIENFDVVCTIDDEVVYSVSTVFGFFPPDAMVAQKGLKISERERCIYDKPHADVIDLTSRPALYFEHPTLHLPDSKLLMLDRITYLDAVDGEAGLGSARGEKDVDVTEWFFKAHFFQDPVQPGSLGIEAMLQLMQAFMIKQNMHQGFTRPRFEPVLIGSEAEWHYRGQITPEKSLITVDFECSERESKDGSSWVLGEARLWGDGLKIYHAPNIGMRIVEDSEGRANQPNPKDETRKADVHWQLDLKTSPWIADHRPTYTVPSLPIMAELDLMAAAVVKRHPRLKIVGIPRADAKSWLAFHTSAVKGHSVIGELAAGKVDVQLFYEGDAEKLVASAQFSLATEYPEAPPPAIVPLQSGREVIDIYASGSLFHGPAFQLLTRLEMGTNGASGVLNLANNGVPVGVLNPGLLDAALHCIPHDDFKQWSDKAPSEHVAYPLLVEGFVQYRPLPTSGIMQVEARFVKLRARRFPRTHIWLLAGGATIAQWSLTEVLMPKGPLGMLPAADRKMFLTGERYVEDAGITSFDGESTSVEQRDIDASNWLRGTLEQIYGYAGSGRLVDRIVVAEHAGRALRLPPSRVSVNDQGRCLNVPLNDYFVQVSDAGCASGQPAALNWKSIRNYWVGQAAGEHLLVHDLGAAMVRQFVRHIVLQDPEDFQRRHGLPAIYLANHQVYAESFLFLCAIGALTGIPAAAIAKQEHQQGWIGAVYRLAESEMADNNPMQILFLDREDPADLLRILDRYRQTIASQPRSLLVHVEGTRASQAGQQVQKVSSVLIDLAINCNVPIVPLRFVGGLPLQDAGQKFDFPVAHGKQDHYIGAALSPELLSSTPYKERASLILDGINRLGPDGSADVPIVVDAAFRQRLDGLSSDVGQLQEVLLAAVQSMPETGSRMQRLLTKIDAGKIEDGDLTPAEMLAVRLLVVNPVSS